MTRREKLLGMTDEELAAWLQKNESYFVMEKICYNRCLKETEDGDIDFSAEAPEDCICCIVEWLNGEAENGEEMP